MIKTVTPPASFTPTTFTFEKISSVEYDLPAGHWRHTVTKGNAKTVTYLDGFWRPVMVRTFDATSAATEAATRKVVVKAYDFNGKTWFESYPQRTADTYPTTGADSIAITTPGTRTTYDTLGRATHIESDSELGLLNTDIAYLNNFQTQTTNPRGFVTTQSFWALDDPGQGQLAGASLPENVSLSISRDILGKPSAITRSGNGKSVARSYVYYPDDQRLCKTVEPEVGATIQHYDTAGNIEWRAPGQLSLLGTSGCDDTAVASAGKITYGYDTLNRLNTTVYGDASPAISRTYKPDGLPDTVVSNGSTWAYEYNELRQLKTETFNTAGSNYVFTRGYNLNGDLSTLTYPAANGSALSVDYNPNALGEAGKVGGYASNLAYHPNGAVSNYTLGNQIVHSLTQYVRGLPWVNQDAGVLKDTYTYDQNGNVATITDGQEGVTNRAMSYDGLDRLTAANAPNVWGSASYTYDALDNLLTANVGARNTALHYDTSNKLDKVTVNGVGSNIAYDPYGNIRSKGGQGYTFDMGNRMSNATAGSSYAYDGDGRRFLATAGDRSTRLTLYSQGGQLLYSESGVSGNTLPATVTYSCSSGNLVNGQCETANTYGATPTYSCTGSDVRNGSTCTHTTSSSYTATWNDYTCNAGDPAPNGSTCTHTTTSNYTASVASYSCNAGDGSPNGSTCTHTTTSTYTGSAASYACNAGDGSPSGSTCTHVTTSNYTGSVTGYSCNAGDPAASGSTCTHTTTTDATVNYSCPSDYTRSGSTCSKTINTAATVGHDCGTSGISPEVYSASPNGYACVSTTDAYSTSGPAQADCQGQASSYGLSLISVEFHKLATSYCRMASRVVYSCPSGGSVSGNQCVSTSTQAASVTYSCSSGSVSGSQCLSTSNYTGSVSGYSCNAGDGAPSGSTCTHTTSSTYTGSVASYSCNAGDPAPNGSTCSHTSSAPYAATPNYSCNAGDPAPNGSSCTHSTAGTYTASGGAYTCPSGGSVSGNQCTVTSTNDYAASVTYNCTAGDGLNVSTCTHTSYAQPTPHYTCTSGTVNGQSCIGVDATGRTAYIYLGSKQIAEVKEGVVQYVHTDALGSPVAHTNGGGTVLNRTRFEPYGFAAAGTKPGVATAGQTTTGARLALLGMCRIRIPIWYTCSSGTTIRLQGASSASIRLRPIQKQASSSVVTPTSTITRTPRLIRMAGSPPGTK